MFRKKLSLTLGSILFLAPWARADSVACVDTQSDGPYLASFCDNHIIVIAGPKGVEQFVLPIGFVDVVPLPAFYLNGLGQVVASFSVFGDTASVYAIYGQGGGNYSTLSGGYRGGENPPGSTVQGNLGSFRMDLGPDFLSAFPGNDCNLTPPPGPGNWDCPTGFEGFFGTSLLMTGLDEQGHATGRERYAYLYHPAVEVQASWTLPSLVGEPPIISLILGELLVLLVVWKGGKQ